MNLLLTNHGIKKIMALATSSTVFDIFEINFRALILAVIVGVSCSLILKRSSDSGRMADVYTGDGGGDVIYIFEHF